MPKVVLVVLVGLICACGGGAAPSPSPSGSAGVVTPRPAPATDRPSVPAPRTASPEPTPEVTPEPPATPATKAAGFERPRRGIEAEVGDIQFGSDYEETGTNVRLTEIGTGFDAGSEIAWRVTLPNAEGGEEVIVVLINSEGGETVIDQFDAEAGWNVYYGKAALADQPGRYRLRYVVEDEVAGFGRFRIKAE